MKIDFTSKFTNFNGDVLKDQESGRELSLGEICIESLLTTEKNNPIEGKKKLERYNLALAIHNGTKDSLDAEEVVLLKELIGKFYAPMIVGQAFPLLDGDNE